MNIRMSCMFLIPNIKNGLYIFIFNINEENLHNIHVVDGCSQLYQIGCNRAKNSRYVNYI